MVYLIIGDRDTRSQRSNPLPYLYTGICPNLAPNPCAFIRTNPGHYRHVSRACRPAVALRAQRPDRQGARPR